MKKKLLALLLVATAATACAFGLAGCNNNDKVESPETTEIFSYTLNSDGTGYSVTDVRIHKSHIEIPASYNDLPVTSIGSKAFENYYGATCITIPDSITNIDDDAFSNCRELTNITIPDSVTCIGKSVFWNCRELNSIVIGSGVTSISESAFQNCSGLTSITIPNSVTNIGNYAFQNCSGLTSITIPNSVTNIGNYAFSDCYRLTSITIPNSVTSIDDYAFSGCSELTNLIISDGVTSINSTIFCGCCELTSISIGENSNNYKSVNNCILSKDGETLILGCKTSDIPNSVTSISPWAFDSCSKLTSITIPDSVTSIGQEAFRGCNSLSSITVSENNLTYKSENNCLLSKDGKDLILCCKTSVIPDSVTIISSDAFNGCSELTNITIPKSVNMILAMLNSKLTSITFKGTIEQWKAIYKTEYWDHNTTEYIVHCTDGKLDKDGNVIE